MTRRFLSSLFLGAGLAVALLVVNIALTYRNTRQLYDDATWVAHTQAVVTSLESVLSLTKDAETGQRGFVITGAPEYLEPYNSAVRAIDGAIADLKKLTADNPRQQERIVELHERISARMETLEQVIELRRRDGIAAASAAIMEGRGKLQMDAVRELAAEMTDEEISLLQKRSQKSRQTFRSAVTTGVVTGLSALGAIGAFLFLFQRHLTTRTKAANIIAEQGERWRTTLASIGDAVIATDEEARVTSMNAVAESLTGWSSRDALHQPLTAVFKIVNEETRQPVENPALRALTEGVIVGLANHTVLISRDGSERAIDDSAAPIRCREGEIVGSVLVFRDVTERRKAEQDLRESVERERRTANELRQVAAELSEGDRRKNEFLAMLAHELRNPLAPIRNALQIVQLSHGNGETIRSASEMMDRQIGHLVRLVDDLLDVSRISRGKIDLRRERVELAPIIQQALETTRPALAAARHELTVSLPSGPIYLQADAVRLAQVFSNLLSNAAKYTDPGGRVEISAERAGSDVVVSVKDSGIGIPPEMLPRIFDMFTQVDRSLERSQGGLGIGLTLVQRIVDLHSGSVQAKSAGPGQGSEFIVRLPLAVENATPAAPPPTARPKLASRRRILVVDDNRDAASSLSALLQISGNETQTAHDGEQALAAADSFRPDVLLLDIGLPKLNGYEVARKLRELPWGQRIVLVALTGWGQEEDRQKSKNAGFDSHMVKPVDLTALARLLEEMPARPA